MVCKRRAPIFSVVSLTCQAALAMACTPSSLKSIATPSVANNAIYCSVNEAKGSVSILTKSSLLFQINAIED